MAETTQTRPAPRDFNGRTYQVGCFVRLVEFKQDGFRAPRNSQERAVVRAGYKYPNIVVDHEKTNAGELLRLVRITPKNHLRAVKADGTEVWPGVATSEIVCPGCLKPAVVEPGLVCHSCQQAPAVAGADLAELDAAASAGDERAAQMLRSGGRS